MLSSSTRRDQKISLADKVERLGAVIFHAELGSLLDKAERLKTLVKFIVKEIGVTNPSYTKRPPHIPNARLGLCKADSNDADGHRIPQPLQGITGRYYALNSGEPEPVATAIA